MILHLLEHLNKLRIILASASPRRTQILNQLGLKFTVRVSTFEENLSKAGRTPAAYVVDTARQKALDVYKTLRAEAATATAAGGGAGPADIVISADTVVVLGDTILEKPRDKPHAVQMLSSLSGRSHHVFTGVTIVYAAHLKVKPSAAATATATATAATDSKATAATVATSTITCDADGTAVETFFDSSEVTFASVPLSLIESYVASGEPMDKAGGYGIQGSGGSFVKGVSGCFLNVVGFPLHAFCTRIEQRFVELAKTGTAAGAASDAALAAAKALPATAAAKK